MTQLPSIKQPRDAGISVGLARGQNPKGYEVQAYYSPYKQVVLMGSYMNFGKKAVLENIEEGLSYRFYDFAAGVYEVLEKGTASLIAGYGVGDLYNYFRGDEYADMEIERWFIQPGLLYVDGFFQGGVSVRISRLNYSSGKIALAIPPEQLRIIENIEHKSPMFLPEIGLVGALRFSPVIFGINVAGIFPQTDNLNFSRINASIFLTVEMGKLLHKKKQGSD